MAKEVKAKFDYNSGHEDDLSFSAGQIIRVTEEVDDEWFSGGYKGLDGKRREGMFPRNFVTAYTSSQATAPVAKREDSETKAMPRVVSPVTNSQPSTVAPKLQPAALPEASVNAASSTPPSAAKRDSRSLTRDAATTQKTEPQGRDSAEPKAEGLSSFRDRIAAFNKTSDAPLAPKPMPKPASFVRKPFIPPPPSKQAYFTPPKPTSNTKSVLQSPPPENREKSETMETQAFHEPNSEPEVSKDTMKEKILAIQRGLEYSAKPPVPRSRKPGSPHTLQDVHIEEPAADTVSEGSEEDDAQVSLPDLPLRQDNEHDHEELESTAKPEASENTPESPPHHEEKESSESEIDPEVARRIAIRERMAKMSGGMGMHMGLGMAPPPFGKPKSQSKSFPPSSATPPTERQDPIPIIPGLPSRRPADTHREAEIITEDHPTSPNLTLGPQLPAALERDSPPERQENLSHTLSAPKPSDSSDEDRRSLPSEEESEADEDLHDVTHETQPAESSDDEEVDAPRPTSAEDSVYISSREPKLTAPQRTPSYDLRSPPSVPTARTFTADPPRTARPPPPPPPMSPPSQTAPPPIPILPKYEPLSEDLETSGEVHYGNSDDDDDSSITSVEDYAGEHGTSQKESMRSTSSRPPIPPPPPPPANPPGSPSISVPHPASPPPVPVMSRRFESPASHPANVSSFSPPPVPPMTSFGDRTSTDYSREEPRPLSNTPSSPGPSTFRRTYTERPSLEASQGRGSLDTNRREGGYLAMKEDNIQDGQQWWLEAASPPAAFKNRVDLVFEVEDSTSTKRGGRTTITREVYILYSDYSQTIVTAQYDRDDPSQAAINQRHLPPPAPPTKHELETRHEQVGAQIISLSQGKLGTSVGDGTPGAFIAEILSKLEGCLPSAGIRSHGALVYSNLGNSSTTQFDEIRPGDIVAFRSAVFQAHGGLRGKITTEVGKPDHVAIIQEWNGIKKKLKVLEQRREHKKVTHNSYKIGDLKSGEVHVFRPMPRSWVDW